MRQPNDLHFSFFGEDPFSEAGGSGGHGCFSADSEAEPFGRDADGPRKAAASPEEVGHSPASTQTDETRRR